jgi:protein-arginine kinase activator protein McsA
MSQVCQACQKRPAKTLTQRTDGKRQWRCQICIDKLNPLGSVHGKEKLENAK